eukprot:scaffold51605_cov64-Phaeocystis_antarctica.AAC.7
MAARHCVGRTAQHLRPYAVLLGHVRRAVFLLVWLGRLGARGCREQRRLRRGEQRGAAGPPGLGSIQNDRVRGGPLHRHHLRCGRCCGASALMCPAGLGGRCADLVTHARRERLGRLVRRDASGAVRRAAACGAGRPTAHQLLAKRGELAVVHGLFADWMDG